MLLTAELLRLADVFMRNVISKSVKMTIMEKLTFAFFKHFYFENKVFIKSSFW